MRTFRTSAFWLLIVAVAFLLWQVVKAGTPAQPDPEISYSEFLTRVANGQVTKVIITGSAVRGFESKNNGFRVIAPSNQLAMLDALQQHGVEVWFRDISGGTWPSWILNCLPLVLMIILCIVVIRRR
jgi:ATP-dependent Zn protease